MLTIIILIILGYSFYTGFRRGLILQLVRLIGYMVSLYLSKKFYIPLSKHIEMLIPFPSVQQSTNLVFYNEETSFMLDQAFYKIVSFMILSFVGYLITNLISTLLKKLSYYNLFYIVNHIGGGLVNAVVAYVIIFMVLFTLSLVPVEFIQQQFVNNPLAYRIVSQTPILTKLAEETLLNIY